MKTSEHERWQTQTQWQPAHWNAGTECSLIDQQCRCRLKTVIVQLLWVGAQLPTPVVQYSGVPNVQLHIVRMACLKASTVPNLTVCSGRVFHSLTVQLAFTGTHTGMAWLSDLHGWLLWKMVYRPSTNQAKCGAVPCIKTNALPPS